MASAEIIRGSWHPTGFHGHFRSKSRLDFINEYRQIAKPPPPKSYIKRSKLIPTFHVFSKHDNRHSFQDNAIYFEGGLGRRRFKNGNNKYQPDLLAWMPEKKEWEKSAAQHSVYRLNFQETPAKPIKEHIIKRPKTSFDVNTPQTTTYRYAHGTANPNRDLLSAMSNHGLTTHQNRRVTTQASGRESVANCMSWYNPPAKSAQVAPSRPNRPLVPAATAPVTIVPHPPPGAKPSSATNTCVSQPVAPAAPSLPVRTQPEQTHVQVAMTE